MEQINALEAAIEKLSDEELKAKTPELKELLKQGKSLDEILPEAFAVAREAIKRTVGERAYDVQLIAAIILHQGKIAEQKTGEGKTHAAALTLYLNALTGKGTHLVTVNDYLAKRDAGWYGKALHFLGLSIGCICQQQTSYLLDPDYINPSQLDDRLSRLRPVTRRETYLADVTYGTNNEFGFDYLRDNMVRDLSQMAQTNPNGDAGSHHFAIVDEVDFLLIDQARTPLIISAPMEESNELYVKFSKIVPQLPSNYYEIDEKRKTVHLTELGTAKIEKLLGVKNLYQDFSLAHHLEQAIKASKIFTKDRNYIVKDGQVVIVDEFTGRLMPGRRYSEGLHQAIEAKENVPIQKESKTLATISFQNYFRMYDKLAGMTGTALTEAEEFNKIYNLDTAAIPTNKPIIRHDYADQIYKHQRVKYAAIVKEIQEKHAKGQPVLVGTTSVEKNELVSQLLKRRKIPHQILNAKNHQQEAQIITAAGQKGSVTVATNLAGRGTDIKLSAEVVELGGLHVIGTERHEARRIDNQLRGRGGRQGDPGSSRFYVSLDDDLMRIFGGDRIARLMERFNFPEDMPIEHALITKSIESAQKKVEGYNFDIRKHLVEYDDVINKQREIIYQFRRKILEGESLKTRILEELAPETSFPIDPSFRENYENKEQQLGEATLRQLERAVYLMTLDRLWMDHIDALDELRQGIQLRGYAQKDPLVEFKNDAYGMFKQLMEKLDNEAIDRILKVEMIPQLQPQVKLADIQQKHEDFKISRRTTSSPPNITSTPPQEQKKQSLTSTKIGRNAPCPCGTKKPDGTSVKYKNCCGKKG